MHSVTWTQFQFTEVVFPGSFQLKRVKWNSRNELDWLANWKLVATTWKQIGIERQPQVDKLVKGKFQVRNDCFDVFTGVQRFRTTLSSSSGSRSSLTRTTTATSTTRWRCATSRSYPRTARKEELLSSRLECLIALRPLRGLCKVSDGFTASYLGRLGLPFLSVLLPTCPSTALVVQPRSRPLLLRQPPGLLQPLSSRQFLRVRPRRLKYRVPAVYLNR